MYSLSLSSPLDLLPFFFPFALLPIFLIQIPFKSRQVLTWSTSFELFVFNEGFFKVKATIKKKSVLRNKKGEGIKDCLIDQRFSKSDEHVEGTALNAKSQPRHPLGKMKREE